jgi:hypothetical protein
MGILRRFASAFTDRGVNMNLSANAKRERQVMADSGPGWPRKLELALVWQHRLRRLLGGFHRQKAFDYAIYTLASPDQRAVHHVEHPAFVWESRLESPFI